MIFPGLEARAASLRDVNHIVVILQENHSFDNLWGLWGEVEGEPVNGLPQADSAQKLHRRRRKAFDCLYQNDVNLKDVKPKDGAACAFVNAPFDIDAYITSQADTCPKPYGDSFTKTGSREGYAKGKGEPGGCTRDLTHSFYNEQYQINGGRQNRYVVEATRPGSSWAITTRKNRRFTTICTRLARRITSSPTISSTRGSAAPS